MEVKAEPKTNGVKKTILTVVLTLLAVLIVLLLLAFFDIIQVPALQVSGVTRKGRTLPEYATEFDVELPDAPSERKHLLSVSGNQAVSTWRYKPIEQSRAFTGRKIHVTLPPGIYKLHIEDPATKEKELSQEIIVSRKGKETRLTPPMVPNPDNNNTDADQTDEQESGKTEKPDTKPSEEQVVIKTLTGYDIDNSLLRWDYTYDFDNKQLLVKEQMLELSAGDGVVPRDYTNAINGLLTPELWKQHPEIALMSNAIDGAPTEFLLAYNPFLCSGKIDRITVQGETDRTDYSIKAENGRVRQVHVATDYYGYTLTFQYDSQNRVVQCSEIYDQEVDGETTRGSLKAEYGSSPDWIRVTIDVNNQPINTIQRIWYGKNDPPSECSFTEIFRDDPNDYYDENTVKLNFTYGKNGPETLSESGSDYNVYIYGTTYFSYSSDGLLKDITENSEYEPDVTITYTWTTVSA